MSNNSAATSSAAAIAFDEFGALAREPLRCVPLTGAEVVDTKQVHRVGFDDSHAHWLVCDPPKRLSAFGQSIDEQGAVRDLQERGQVGFVAQTGKRVVEPGKSGRCRPGRVGGDRAAEPKLIQNSRAKPGYRFMKGFPQLSSPTADHADEVQCVQSLDQDGVPDTGLARQQECLTVKIQDGSDQGEFVSSSDQVGVWASARSRCVLPSIPQRNHETLHLVRDLPLVPEVD